jgi:hypothetical protein
MKAPFHFDYKDTPMPSSYFFRKYCISRVQFWRYRRAGLKAIAVGAKIFVRESDFVAFLERMDGQTVTATRPPVSTESKGANP